MSGFTKYPTVWLEVGKQRKNSRPIQPLDALTTDETGRVVRLTRYRLLKGKQTVVFARTSPVDRNGKLMVLASLFIR